SQSLTPLCPCATARGSAFRYLAPESQETAGLPEPGKPVNANRQGGPGRKIGAANHSARAAVAPRADNSPVSSPGRGQLMTRQVYLPLAICAAASVAGCGAKGDAAATVVRGQILYRGDPVSGGMIVFAPNPERGSSGEPMAVLLQEDGTFTL